jgi:hypothetical protein
LGGLPTALVREFVAATTCGDVRRRFVLAKRHGCGASGSELQTNCPPTR